MTTGIQSFSNLQNPWNERYIYLREMLTFVGIYIYIIIIIYIPVP